MNISDGTLCRAVSPRPGPASPDPFAKRQGKLRILGYDGAKVHDLLFHVALAEIEWQDLDVNARSALDAPIPTDRANERALMLYDMFLDACTEGPKAAKAFLVQQHNLQKQYLLKSQAIFESLRRENMKNQVLLSRLLFGAQAVKSAATATIAIAGLFLEAPAAVAGAGIALGYDLVIEFIKHTGTSNEPYADAVVVGFREKAGTFAEVADVVGHLRLEHLERAKEILEKTLRYPRKSSIYRSAVAGGARLEGLLKTLGIISAGATLYNETEDVIAAYEQMQRTENSAH